MPLDPLSPAVAKFMAEIEAVIETKRNALERPQKTDNETNFIRGEIKAMRNILKLITTTGEDDG